MKIQLKQLRPNPFRNVARYPISRVKVEALKASIRTTGFWDNVVVRKAGSLALPINATVGAAIAAQLYEIAYGHHRLEALLELVRESVIDEEFELELPCRNLDDATMIRIMAAENMKEFATTVEVIDETVEATRAFIVRETRTPANEITPSDIAQFLGSGWNEDAVRTSLNRLRLFDQGVLDREKLVGLSATSGRTIQREVAKVMKSTIKAALEKDDDFDEEDRRKINTEAKTLGRNVGEMLVDHIRNGGKSSVLKEVSLEAQAEQIPESAPEDERRLSTIDAAARAVNAREFQRKIELLMKYKGYMSPGAKHELQGTLAEVGGWCSEMGRSLDE